MLLLLNTPPQVSFVDLAGSERLRDSKSSGETMRETTNINRSLFMLGKVISARADGAQVRAGGPWGLGVAGTGWAASQVARTGWNWGFEGRSWAAGSAGSAAATAHSNGVLAPCCHGIGLALERFGCGCLCWNN